MSEAEAKRQLRRMLGSFTPGSVLSLLAELFRESAEEARRDGDMTLYRQCRMAEATLVIVGYGLDAACPQ